MGRGHSPILKIAKKNRVWGLKIALAKVKPMDDTGSRIVLERWTSHRSHGTIAAWIAEFAKAEGNSPNE
jgi:hypothetical protein